MRAMTKAELRTELETTLQEVENLGRENEKLKEEIEKTGVDPLTNLNTGRRMEVVDRILYAYRPQSLRDQREKPAACIMIVDVNGFKKINDTYGYLAADEILRQVAIYLKIKTRPEHDEVLRWHDRGDEFLVTFGGSTAEDVLFRFRDLEGKAKLSFPAELPYRESVDEPLHTKEVEVTLSGGIADCDLTKDPTLCRNEAIEMAERALHKGKALGEIILSEERRT